MYALDVEIWPTNVVIPKGHTLQLEVGPQDQQGGGIFTQRHPQDRVKEKLSGVNTILPEALGKVRWTRSGLVPRLPCWEAMC